MELRYREAWAQLQQYRNMVNSLHEESVIELPVSPIPHNHEKLINYVNNTYSGLSTDERMLLVDKILYSFTYVLMTIISCVEEVLKDNLKNISFEDYDLPSIGGLSIKISVSKTCKHSDESILYVRTITMPFNNWITNLEDISQTEWYNNKTLLNFDSPLNRGISLEQYLQIFM